MKEIEFPADVNDTLIVSLFSGFACLLFNIPLFWILGVSFEDPQFTFSYSIRLREIYGEAVFWIIALVFAMSVELILLGAICCGRGERSRLGVLLSQAGVAIPMAASTLSLLLVADEFGWIDSLYTTAKRVGLFACIAVLVLLCWAVWSIASWRRTDFDVVRTGVRYGINMAIVGLLVAIPAHGIATMNRAWLSGISTHIGAYASAQALLVLVICALWMRRNIPMAEPSPGMHAAASRYALRESLLLACGALLLFVMAYSIYPLVYRDRFLVLLLGQLAFCVLALCAVARGISGLLLRESRPFWMFGAYVFLAELVVLVGLLLILPSVNW